MAPGANEQDVAGLDADAGGGFGGFQFRDADGVIGLQPISPQHARHIKQDAARNDAILADSDRVGAGADRRDQPHRAGVVRLTAPEEMAQRIQVRVRHAVRRNRQIVRGGVDRDAIGDVARAQHGVHRRIGVVGIALGIEGVRARHTHPLAHQSGCAYAMLGGDEIQGAALVVTSPPPPVAAAIEERLEVDWLTHTLTVP
jgi:hypothetical protein